MITRPQRVLTIVFTVLLATPAPGTAQASNPAEVFVAVVDEFPDIDARSLVMREGGRAIVVLRPDEATVDALAMSLVVLDRMSRRPLEPGQGAMAPVKAFLVDVPPTGDRRRRLESTLRRIERAPPASIGALGSGRWVRYR